jgi:hypothetical protein
MSIRFEAGKPTDAEILEQAAGVGLTFPEGSMEEVWFLNFCSRLWSHGFSDGSEAMMESFRKATANRLAA